MAALDSRIEPLLLKDFQVAALLGLTRTSIHRLRNQARIPRPLKLGGATRWRRAEIEAWIEGGCPCTEDWEKPRRCGAKTPSSPPSGARGAGRGRA